MTVLAKAGIGGGGRARHATTMKPEGGGDLPWLAPIEEATTMMGRPVALVWGETTYGPLQEAAWQKTPPPEARQAPWPS
jgi:hypothetical protein